MASNTPNTRSRPSERDLSSPDTELSAESKKNKTFSEVLKSSEISEDGDEESTPEPSAKPVMSSAGPLATKMIMQTFTIPDEALQKFRAFKGKLNRLFKRSLMV